MYLIVLFKSISILDLKLTLTFIMFMKGVIMSYSIKEIANKYNVTSAQIILRWHIQDGYITIPGSSNPEHIKENFDIFNFELTDEEMKRIREIDEQKRYENW